MEGQRYQIRLLVRSSCGEGRFWLPRRADTIWIQASHSVLAERSLFLASQTTTNSAATPGHWGQPRAFLQSKDEEEREVGNRQWKSKHPSQLRHRDERPVPAAETPAVIMLATRFIHVSFCFIRPSFVFHSFHWFQSCFIRAISVIPKGLYILRAFRWRKSKCWNTGAHALMAATSCDSSTLCMPKRPTLQLQRSESWLRNFAMGWCLFGHRDALNVSLHILKILVERKQKRGKVRTRNRVTDTRYGSENQVKKKWVGRRMWISRRTTFEIKHPQFLQSRGQFCRPYPESMNSP